MSRNPQYFRADEGLPRLDQVVFKLKADASEAVAALLSGACDITTHDADVSSLMPLLVELHEEGLLQLVSAPGNGITEMSFGVQSARDYDRPSFFTDARVRQAVAQCVDRQALVDEITYGRGIVPDSYLPPAHPRYPEGSLTHWEYDPDTGQALLDELGWRDADGDGVREAQEVDGVRFGEPLAVTLLTSEHSETSQAAARILRAQLADCGVRVTSDPLPRWELFADGPEGPLFGRRFDLAQVTWWVEGVPPCERYLASQIPEPAAWEGVNVTGYSNSSYDAACRAAQRALPGSTAYERHHRDAQVIFSQDLPALPLFTSLRIALASRRVENFEIDGTADSELWNLEIIDVAGGASSP